jgi:predicted acyl esterase
MKRLVPVLAAGALLGLPATASAVADAPFGHTCHPRNGVRFCPTTGDGQRIPSFDGVPLDVDVTLPPGGVGPFPTIVMLHGFGNQDKTYWETTTPDGGARGARYHFNNIFFAQQGYAVVTYSARGFGRSCGKGQENKPGCQKGWFHFADQRWEVHDAQHLIGRLVDDGVTDPTKIGVTGESYGGGTTLQLAYLRNRVRNVDGSFSPWKSPAGTPLRVAAAWPRWGWSDLAYSLVPNGRFRNVGVSSTPSPFGVVKQAVLDALYIGGTAVAYVSPQGVDPTADIKTWHDRLLAGEPYGADVKSILKQVQTYKSASGLSGKPAPLLVQNGWTDPVFPAEEALRTYNRLHALDKHFPVSLQLGDIGHFTGGEARADYQRFNDDGAAFFGHYLKGLAGGPKPGAVTVFGQGCPKKSPGFGPLEATSYRRLAHGSVRLGLKGPRSVTSGGGDPNTAAAGNPVTHTDRCALIATDSAAGTAVLQRKSSGFTQVGLPVVRATIKTKGSFGQIDARLWDVNGDQQRLVDWGVFRLKPKQKGRIVFQLFGNAYKFVKGHTVKLELVGSNAPALRASNGSFAVKVSRVRAAIPVRQRPSRKRGIARPTRLR